MDEHPLDPALFSEMAESLQKSYERHYDRYGLQTIEFSRAVEDAFKLEVDQVLSALTAGKKAEDVLSPAYHVLRGYLRAMQWVGWCNCEFGPPLGVRCPDDEYALAILVYLSARIIDDAIDGHVDFKGKVENLYGFLLTKMPAREAAALNCLMATLVLNGSLRRLVKKRYIGSAQKLMRLYAEVFPGALVEAFSSGRVVQYDVYRSIIERKSVAYDMMLHSVFFSRLEPLLRSRIFQFLTVYSEVAQWLNDLCDEEDDLSRGQLNILNTPGMNREIVFNRIVHSFYRLWDENKDLPRNLRDVIAVRLRDSVRRFDETRSDAAYSYAFVDL